MLDPVWSHVGKNEGSRLDQLLNAIELREVVLQGFLHCFLDGLGHFHRSLPCALAAASCIIYLTANGCHRLVHSLPFLLPGFGGLAETGLHREGHGGTGSLPGPAE